MTPPCAPLALTRHGHVAHLRWSRPPHNHLDLDFLVALVDALRALDDDATCRAVVLSAEGKTFCAGADFQAVGDAQTIDPEPFYAQALRLFHTRKPMVAAVQGAAIGAGVGLALVADFRVASPEARLSVNFTRLGLHPGFGLSYTLPRLIGMQHATRLFYTGERIDGAAALRLGLVDELVPNDDLVARALALATDIALSAPGAVQTTRETLRSGFAEAAAVANRRELAIQRTQFVTEDFREGVAAMAQRRTPVFQGR